MSLPPHERYQSKLFPGSSHSWALSRIAELSAASRVLDIGSGSGVMGRELSARGFKDVFAVEVSDDARNATSDLYKKMAPSLSELNQEGPFNLVLLLDVIEHMTEPGDFLKTLPDRIAPGGKLLISVPNIAHWAIRLMLLAGYFEYMERGPLDKTHFRFFTRRSLAKLIESIPGFELKSISGSIVPLELMVPELLWKNPVFAAFSALRIQAANNLPGLFAYQLLAEIERK